MGRPINKKYFGADVDNTLAVANYDTDGAGTVGGITVVSGGAGYAASFSVTVVDGAESAIIDFTVAAGVVTGGALDSQTGAFTFTQTDVAISMPVPNLYPQPYQLLATGRIPGQASAAVYIIKQKSNRKFLCALASNPTITGILTTCNDAVPASGFVSFAVAPYGGGTKYAKTIQGRRLKTFDGYSYAWSDVAASANAAGEADLGTDTPK